MQNIKQYFSSIKTSKNIEWSFICELGTIEIIQPGTLVITKDELNYNEIFIEKGVLRSYLIDDEGNEKNIAFFDSEQFISQNTLRTKNAHSLYYYESITNSKIITFNSKKLKALLSSTKGLSVIGKHIKDLEIDRISKRELCLSQKKARDKYQYFLKHYPNLEKVVSQKHIASYLGITPVSLSRIKKNLYLEESVNN